MVYSLVIHKVFCDSFCFLLSYTPLTPSSARLLSPLPVPPTKHFGEASSTLSSFCCGRRTRKFLVLLHSGQPSLRPRPRTPTTRIHNTSYKYEKSLRLYVAKPTIKSQSVYSVMHWDWNRRRWRRRLRSRTEKKRNILRNNKAFLIDFFRQKGFEKLKITFYGFVSPIFHFK